jgi:hypothetical protein
MELASKERIAQIQATAMIGVAQGKAESDRALAIMDAKLRSIDQLVKIDLARLQAAAKAPPSGASPEPTPAQAESVPPSAPPPSLDGSLPAPMTAPPAPVG